MKKESKRKLALRLIICFYILVMIASTLFIPIKAVVDDGRKSDPDAFTEQGYYPIWQLKNWKKIMSTGTGNTDSFTEVTITLNTLAWIIQYIALTGVFASLYYQTHRYFK